MIGELALLRWSLVSTARAGEGRGYEWEISVEVVGFSTDCVFGAEMVIRHQ